MFRIRDNDLAGKEFARVKAAFHAPSVNGDFKPTEKSPSFFRTLLCCFPMKRAAEKSSERDKLVLRR